jgi:hypothetical protein
MKRLLLVTVASFVAIGAAATSHKPWQSEVLPVDWSPAEYAAAQKIPVPPSTPMTESEMYNTPLDAMRPSGAIDKLKAAMAAQSTESVNSATVSTQKSFNATNSEKGCLKLGMIMSTRLEELDAFNEAFCRDMKTQSKGELETCAMATALMYNRAHRRFDLDRLPPDVAQDTMKGCGMMVYDVSEAVAEHVVKRARR